MLKVKFTVDEDIIARFMLTSKKLKDFIPDYYSKLKQEKVDFLDSHKFAVKDRYIKEIKEYDMFKRILEQSYKNESRLEEIFSRNNKKLTMFLSKILKIKNFSIEEQTVYVFDYHVNAGCNIGNNKILFGMLDEKRSFNENYELTYLIHEILHSFFRNNDITHAIIENIADFELCKFLNNSSWHYHGHCSDNYSLVDLHKKIYPYWNLYLNKDKKEIESDTDFNEFKYNVDDFEHLRKELKNMDILEFTNFLYNLNELKLELIN